MDNGSWKLPKLVIIFTLVSAGVGGCAKQALDSSRTPIKETVADMRLETTKIRQETPESISKTSTASAPEESPRSSPVAPLAVRPTVVEEINSSGVLSDTQKLAVPNTLAPSETETFTTTIIGRSHENRPILAYQFGAGSDPVVLVGGLHGGYEWNTILLAYEIVDYFTEHPEQISESITLYIVPSANPDGQYAVTGKEGRFEPEDLAANTIPGRFSGSGVDLNRNWDCLWSETAFWSSQAVNPGASPFSEPETRALRDFFFAVRPQAVIFYHSAADGVYPAGCPQLHPAAMHLADIYASAAGYPLFDIFAHYDVTGDAGSWLATQGIPAISVELADHEDMEWDKNRRGIFEVMENLDSLSPKEFAPPNSLLPDD